MKTSLPPTKGRGKWGRKIKRAGSGLHVRVTTGVLVEHRRTPGVIHQTFYSSPRLREWFENHDALIDSRIERAERAEYERLCRECAAYRARKAVQKKAGR